MSGALKLLTTLLFLLASATAQSEILVIANQENQVSSLSKREIIELYMGRHLFFKNGTMALRLDQAPESEVRQQFYRKLVDKSVAEINAYWAKLLFTGRATPPQVLSDDSKVIAVVRDNKNAIGYIDAEAFDGTVKVVARVP